MIRDRLVMGVSDKGTQQALLREPKLTLAQAVKTALAEEAARRDQQVINAENTANHHAICVSDNDYCDAAAVSGGGYCRFCMRQHSMQRSACPAFNRFCRTCGRRHHFAGSVECSATAGGDVTTEAGVSIAAPSGRQRTQFRRQPTTASLGAATQRSYRGGERRTNLVENISPIEDSLALSGTRTNRKAFKTLFSRNNRQVRSRSLQVLPTTLQTTETS